MKKFKHSNADLEMARIQTEREKTRALDTGNDAGVDGNDGAASGSGSDTGAQRSGSGIRTRGNNGRNGDGSRSNKSGRPGHVKNISNISDTGKGTRYKRSHGRS